MGCLDITPQSCKPDVNRSEGTPQCPALCDYNDDYVGIPLYDTRAVNCTVRPRISKRDNILWTSKTRACDNTIIEQPVNEFTLNRRYAERAENLIAKAAASKSPFFLYVGFAHTHTPTAYENEKWANASKRPG